MKSPKIFKFSTKRIYTNYNDLNFVKESKTQNKYFAINKTQCNPKKKKILL